MGCHRKLGLPPKWKRWCRMAGGGEGVVVSHPDHGKSGIHKKDRQVRDIALSLTLHCCRIAIRG